MDMTMCDVSEIDCKEGERIFVYKSAKHFYELSKNIDTIPYELISTISQRVPRKFTYE
ncbi:MAG: Alanine racemase [Bacteroidetes bacterium MED-G17]|nr:MAG: Alanine racemase [Bacteroidetes bacterium MED-G17]